MAHRGPDDGGIETREDATLGMRRLAIFDPANGHQPMQTPDGRHTIVFNGAIYNFQALKSELAAKGRTFRTECDTEVLLAAYAEWGTGCLRRLRGMFAFAVWDRQERTLCLARDPLGIKPLYYRQDGGRLLFASEINALRAARVFDAEIDPLAVADYLAWFSVPAPRTIYRGVLSLRPGECALWRDGRLDIRAAWNFSAIPADARPCASHEEFLSGLREQLRDSIRAHMLADVPVGAFLSGGLDSAVVVGLMSQASGTRLKTFSIGFEERDYSEAEAAAETARHFGTDHHARMLTGVEVAGDVEKLLDAFDQPTGDGINTYYVSQAAHASGVKVTLSGLGGDELFGGYPSFRNLPRLARLLPLWRTLPGGLKRLVSSRLGRGETRGRKLADFLIHAHDIQELAAMQRRVFSESRWRSLLGPEALALSTARTPFHPEIGALRSDLAAAGPFEIASAWELRTYMADVLLRDSDVMSMRHSLELRVPFVDRPLIEWLWRQPAQFKYTPRHPKSALSEAVSDILPPAVLSRGKHGFTLPFALWMRRELKPFLDETFSDASVDRSGLFQRSAVQSCWRGFLGHHDSREWSRVWSLAVVIAFINRRTLAGATASGLLPAARPMEFPKPAPEGKIAAAPPPRSISPSASEEESSADNREKRSYRHVTLLLAPELFSSVGGIQRMLQIYLKALCDLGAERNEAVRVVALNDPALDTSDLRRYTNSQLDNWYVCNRNKRRFVRAALRMARGCDRVVCGHVAQLPVAWLARVFNPRLRYFLVAHGIEVWRSFPLIERIALRGATRILCVSDYTRGELLKNCRLRRERVVVVPNALDPVFEDPPTEPLAGAPPVIFTATRLTYSNRYKGVEHLIAAMPAVRAAEPRACLRIVGSGNDLPRLQGIARQHGVLDAGVEFLGGVDDRRLRQELRDCRLFALPSKSEGFGLVYLEAMAQGRPCLGARAGGVPEVITEDTGVLVEFGNVEAIAAAIIAALRRPWSEEALIGRSRKFSFDVFKERLGSVLEL